MRTEPFTHVKRMNPIIPIGIAILGSLHLSACNNRSNQPIASESVGVTHALAEVIITNPSSYPRRDQAVYLDMRHLGLLEGADTASLGFVAKDQAIAHQFIDSEGDGNKDQALLMLDLDAEETVDVNMRSGVGVPAIAKRSHAEIGIKTGGNWDGIQYVGGVFQNVEAVTPPEQYTDHSEYIRYEGPGIESDLIGYRVYLDWRNGFDIFGKTKPGLVLDQVGQDGYQSYHEAQDWGMDILKVGPSVGVGGFGYWENNAITRVSEVDGHRAEIIEDGALYSAFSIDYKNWQVAGKTTDLNAQFAMQAGSPLVNVKLHTDPALQQLAVGLVKHKDARLITGSLDITGEAWSYMATIGPQAIDGQALVMFTLFEKKNHKAFVEDEYNHDVLLRLRNGELNYYFGAQWAGMEGADLSDTAVIEMLEKQVEALTLLPRIQVSNRSSDDLKAQLGGVKSAMQWSTLAADSEIARHGRELAFGSYDTMRQRMANWEYTMGMMTQAVYQVAKKTGNDQQRDWAIDIVDSYVTEDGELRSYDISKYNIDSVNSGKMLLQLYRDTGKEKYKIAAGHLRKQLQDHPRQASGAFWHKKRYPHQLWLDGVYMGMPFLAEYTLMFEGGAALEQVVEEFRVVREHLRDSETGLYFHAWDEHKQQVWADKNTGLSHYFWSRGMGWLAMAIVDTLALVPEDYTELRAELIAMAKDLADTLLKYQDKDGVWHQITNMQGKAANYRESSASTMFTYMLMKGVADGVLPASYLPVATQAYDALIEQFILQDASGSMHVTQACQVAGLGYGRDGSYDYYMSEPVIENDPKVLAPFIMLGPIVERALAQSN